MKLNRISLIFSFFLMTVFGRQTHGAEPPKVRVGGPTWESALANCDQPVNWPSLTTYQRTQADMYYEEYLCSTDSERIPALLISEESRDCTLEPPRAFLNLFWTCLDAI